MNRQELNRFLKEVTDLEKACREQPRYLVFTGPGLSKPYAGPFVPAGDPDIVPESYIMASDQKIAFSKHPRYAAVRDHRHSFIELQYVYSGSITQTINGRRVTMREGEMCLLDTNVVHAIEPAGENDILINCLMRKSYFGADMLGRLAGNDILSDFLINAVYRSTEFNQYLLLPTQGNPKIRRWMCEALCEFFEPGLCSGEIINSYIVLLFSELLRVYKDQRRDEERTAKKTAIADILVYLESHYQTVTLESAARHFHFHPNYLSRTLKKALGQSFVKIVTDIRMKKARVFLENTDFPVVKIAAEIGYSNLKHFYDNYKERYGVTPAAYRRQMRMG